MTNEEIKRELSKIPEEDKKRINGIEKLDDNDLANLAGGMTPKTKKILKRLAIAGAFGTALGTTAAIAYKSGRSSGINESEEKYKQEMERQQAEADKNLKEATRRAALAGKVAGNVEGYYKGLKETSEAFANTLYNNDSEIKNWATTFAAAMILSDYYKQK